MDADESLAELRTVVYIMKTILDGGELGDWWATGWALVDGFEAIDAHLTSGGALPESWGTRGS